MRKRGSVLHKDEEKRIGPHKDEEKRIGPHNELPVKTALKWGGKSAFGRTLTPLIVKQIH